MHLTFLKNLTNKVNVCPSRAFPPSVATHITQTYLNVSFFSSEPRGVKQESNFVDDSFYNEDSMDQNHVEAEPVLAFEEPVQDVEDRQMAIMEKMVSEICKLCSLLQGLVLLRFVFYFSFCLRLLLIVKSYQAYTVLSYQIFTSYCNKNIVKPDIFKRVTMVFLAGSSLWKRPTRTKHQFFILFSLDRHLISAHAGLWKNKKKYLVYDPFNRPNSLLTFGLHASFVCIFILSNSVLS